VSLEDFIYFGWSALRSGGLLAGAGFSENAQFLRQVAEKSAASVLVGGDDSWWFIKPRKKT